MRTLRPDLRPWSRATMAAFQTNNYLGQSGQGAACSEPVTNPTPCTATTFLDLLETGIFPLGKSNPLRAQYIEVFPANANAFQEDILAGHDLLVPQLHRRAPRRCRGSGAWGVRAGQ